MQVSKEDFEKEIKELEADCKKLVDLDKRFELAKKVLDSLKKALNGSTAPE
ncbi:MAG: hypothetical protein VX737_00815 [Pseudomonadota bacterium]|nr:hypothetical protein [Pseudomonadota bacterium]